MTRSDHDLDEYGRHVLAALLPVPVLDSQVAAEAKKQFLMQAESLRQDYLSQPRQVAPEKKLKKPKGMRIFQSKPLLKAMLAALLAVLVILAGSSLTVYAAQSSLPGDPLYTVKSWSEDVRLSMNRSTIDKLNLTLDYTNRRVNEISSLVSNGKALNDQTYDRLTYELDDALLLAAQLDDTQIQNALGKIKSHAENQGMTLEELIHSLPPQAQSAMERIQARLVEQVQLSVSGESDPTAFRVQIRERMQHQQGPKHTPSSNQPESTASDQLPSPIPGQNGNDDGNKTNQPHAIPGYGDPGNGKGESTPENGTHGPNQSHP